MIDVSIIIPTYNRSSLITKTIYSAINQSYANFEILIIDDGSTDDTQQKISEIKDERIKYYYKENGGVSSARNLGFCEAKGKYIALLDSDDIWPTNYLEKMINALNSNPEYGLAYCQFKNYLQDGTIKNGFECNQNFSGWFTKQYYNYKRPLYFLPSCSIIRKETCKDFCFDEVLKYHEDHDFFLRLSAKTQFLFVDDICIQRNIVPGGLSRGEPIIHNRLLVFERFYFRFGGKKLIPRRTAFKKVSERYRGLGRQHYKEGNRKAAVELFKKAVRFHPYCLKNYRMLLKALLLSRKNDKMPGWRMPEPLPDYITVSKRKIYLNNCQMSGCSKA